MLFAGTSPAPKQGPQNAVFITAPASISLFMHPILLRAYATGWLCGYTDNEKRSLPVSPFPSISEASIMFSYVPPAHPAIIP